MPATLPQGPTSRTLNVRLPLGLYQQFEDLATATARTKSFVAVEALVQHLQAQSWQVQDIHSGLAEADRGEFASDADAKAMLNKYGA